MITVRYRSRVNVAQSSIVKAVYISHFALLDNEESFPKVMVNSASSLIPLFFQGHVTLYPES